MTPAAQPSAVQLHQKQVSRHECLAVSGHLAGQHMQVLGILSSETLKHERIC